MITAKERSSICNFKNVLAQSILASDELLGQKYCGPDIDKSAVKRFKMLDVYMDILI
jgi:hypothetical protein